MIWSVIRAIVEIRLGYSCSRRGYCIAEETEALRRKGSGVYSVRKAEIICVLVMKEQKQKGQRTLSA